MALYNAGLKCRRVVSRSYASAEMLAGLVVAEKHGSDLSLLHAEDQTLLMTLPDDALHETALRLAALRHWHGVLVLHTSAALHSKVLQPLEERGAMIASAHPALSLAGDVEDWRRMRECFFVLEAKEGAFKRAESLLRNISSRILPLDAEHKLSYHLACVCVANYLVTLHAVSREIASDSGLPGLGELLADLSASVLHNLRKKGPAKALTGPIARGDIGTVSAHLQWLQENMPQWLHLYCHLGLATLDVLPSDSMNAPAHQIMRERFHEVLENTLDASPKLTNG